MKKMSLVTLALLAGCHDEIHRSEEDYRKLAVNRFVGEHVCKNFGGFSNNVSRGGGRYSSGTYMFVCGNQKEIPEYDTRLMQIPFDQSKVDEYIEYYKFTYPNSDV